MTPTLLFPLGLAALAAVIVPLVIHIARKSEVRPTDFAALRWLRQKPKPKNRLRFDEWPLLILRLLLLTLLAFWLARPALFGGGAASSYVAVVPGTLIEGVQGIDPKTAHWLAPGFPLVKTPPPTGTNPVASLIRQLDAELPPGTALSIVTPGVISGADAERPRLTRTVDWRVVAGIAVPRASGPATPPEPVSIRYDASHAGGVRYLRAAVAAWASPASQTSASGTRGTADVAGAAAGLPATGRTLVWLVGGTVPKTITDRVAAGATALTASDAVWPDAGGRATERASVWRDASGRALVEVVPLGRGRLMRFTRVLTAADMPELVEPDFSARLKATLAEVAAAPSRVAARDYAPVVGAANGGGFAAAPLDVRPWLAVLIALVLLGERWLATSRRRGAQL